MRRACLAVLALALTSGAGLELLSNLRDTGGDIIPVVVLSPHAPTNGASPLQSTDASLDHITPAPQRWQRAQRVH